MKAFTVVATLGVIAALGAGATKAAPARIVGGGVQTRPGGMVVDRAGGAYDPPRSIYILRANGGR